MSRIEIFGLSTRNVSRLSLEGLEQNLGDDIRKKVNTFRFERDRLGALLSHLFVKHLLEQNTGTGIPQLEYAYSKNGKPRVVNLSNLYFNVSHSGHWIVCALDSDELGIDIEEIRDLSLDEISESLTDHEMTQIKATSPNLRTSLFYRIWTAKESYLKAIGEGLSGSVLLEELNIVVFNDEIELQLRGEAVKNWSLNQIKFSDNYCLMVCSKRSKNIKKEVTIIDIEDIIRGSSNSNY